MKLSAIIPPHLRPKLAHMAKVHRITPLKLVKRILKAAINSHP